MQQPPSLVIGLDIGASKILAGLVTQAGDIRRQRLASTAATPARILLDAQTLCQRLLDEADAPVLGIGVGSAGMVDTDSATIIYANYNLPGWTGTQLADISVAGLPVCAENDARSFAYGESRLGAGAGYGSLLCLTVGTGIGGAIIIDDEIWHGAAYSAGEIGYMAVGWDDAGPLVLDQFASGPAIERAYQAASEGERRLPLPAIRKRAVAGDQLAADVIRRKASQLGAILAGLVAAIGPEAVVIGGGVPQAGALWWDALKAAFRGAAPPPLQATPLLPAALGVEAVMLGAAMLAWREALT